MIAVTGLALLAGYGTWHSSFGNQLELRTIDARFDVRGTQKPDPGVVIVGIDIQTIETGLYGRFPFARRFDAQMIDRLRRDGAKVIAYDLAFESGSDPSDDLALFHAAERARGRLVLAATASAKNGSGATYVLGGVKNQRTAGIGVGSADFTVASDGAIRSVPGSVKGTQSFAVATARAAGVPRPTIASEFASGLQWIDFPGPAGTVPLISFYKVLAPGFDASLVRGKIVVVGATSPDLQDLHAVGGFSPLMSGPEIEADAISTLLARAQLRSAPGYINWLLLILAAVLLPFLAWRRVRWPLIVLVGLGAAAALVIGTQIAFDSGTISLFLPVLAALFVGGVGSVLVPLALERRELALLRDRFARFDPSVVDAVLADPGAALRARALAIGPESVVAGYRIVALLGRGGMGVVYEAVQLTLERPVALKLINPARVDDEEFRARFVRESHVAAGLEHPHVIPVYEAREDGGLLFIAMRLVRGPSLADVLTREAPLAPVHAARLIAQVAAALGAAHARGLVHRDVKPANILLHERDHTYLTDFGVTRELGTDGLTSAGERLGTVDYMAPEQARAERVGPAADIYSLGCVLYEALTGRVPYVESSEAARIAAHLHDPVPHAAEHWPAVPRALDEVIVQALDKDPARRFISAQAFAAALAQSVGISPPSPTAAPSLRAPIAMDSPTLTG
ncbi:MAG TPA: CHASE2 domain-containing protein [Solirubrobacteraceae bacterium]|jgi:CHASE2 domain-containing sensor protein